MNLQIQLELGNIVNQIKNQQFRLKSSEGFNATYKRIINEELDNKVEKEAKDVLIKELAEKQTKLDKQRKPNILKANTVYKEKPQVNKYEEIGRLKRAIKSNNARVINTFQSWSYRNSEFTKNTKYKGILKWNKKLLEKVTEEYKKYVLEGTEKRY